MRDKLIVLTVIVLFAFLLAAVAPRVNALAAELGGKFRTVECAAGYKLEQLPDGGVRIRGMCAVVVGENDEGPVRPDGEPETGPNYEYPYPVPGEVYPDPGNDECNVPWIWGESCP